MLMKNIDQLSDLFGLESALSRGAVALVLADGDEDVGEEDDVGGNDGGQRCKSRVA